MEKITIDELFGENQALADKNRSFARLSAVGEAARLAAQLEPISDLMIDGGIETARQRVYEETLETKLGEYNTSAGNDLRANNAGFVALLSFGVRDGDPRVQAFDIAERSFEDPEVYQIDAPEEAQVSYGLRVPHGKLFTRENHERNLEGFRVIVDSPNFVFDQAHGNEVFFRPLDVVRIETNDGGLWQNPGFTPQGVIADEKALIYG